MATIEQPVESAIQPTTYRASWRMAALGLAALYCLEMAYALFWMWPLNSADSWDQRWFLTMAGAGTVFSLPMLMAMLGAVAPGRIGVRLLVSASLAVLAGYALIVGQWAGENRSALGDEAASVVFTHLWLFWPAIAIKRWRRWTIVPQTRGGPLSGRQYSVAGIMLATVCVAIVFGVGRWVLPLARWPGGPDLWGVISIRMILLSGAIAWTGLPLVSLTALVLGERRRVVSLVATVATMAVVALVLQFILLLSAGTRGMPVYAAMMTGAYFSGFVWLLVIRACGFRLVSRAKYPNVEASAGLPT